MALGRTFADNDSEVDISSISFGSLEDGYLLLDSEDASDLTALPLANPPSDASYSSSFMEMVRQSVQRAQTIYNLDPISQAKHNDEDDSFESILHFGSSQDNEVDSLHTEINEERIEVGRHQEREADFIPVGLESQQSQENIPEFAFIREDPLSVSHLRYTTSKRKKKEQQVKMALEAVSAQLLPDTEKESFLCFLQEQDGKEDDNHEEAIDDDQDDFSSWLCFDSQGSYAKFKHDIEDKIHQSSKPEQNDEESKEDSFSDLQQRIMMTSTPKRTFNLSQKRV
ncbi:hypothetical protein BD560DRAFT_411248 [Blakeslea trispora]|nr:hypothetical protein BD560DRAFT_411248 [Blakeslea trispora]